MYTHTHIYTCYTTYNKHTYRCVYIYIYTHSVSFELCHPWLGSSRGWTIRGIHDDIDNNSNDASSSNDTTTTTANNNDDDDNHTDN